MNSRTTKRFRDALAALPADIQRRAREAYLLFRQNPHHPSLRFKKVHSMEPIYSARITLNYRALGVVHNNEIVWFWIGSHADYENILART